jgi:hypothetical protein
MVPVRKSLPGSEIQLIAWEPSVVWAVLEDESRYADWVVRTFDSAPGKGRWPELGSLIKYTVFLGPKEVRGRTTVRRLDMPRALNSKRTGAVGYGADCH